MVAPEESDEAQRQGLVRDDFQQDVEFQDFLPSERSLESIEFVAIALFVNLD